MSGRKKSGLKFIRYIEVLKVIRYTQVLLIQSGFFSDVFPNGGQRISVDCSADIRMI